MQTINSLYLHKKDVALKKEVETIDAQGLWTFTVARIPTTAQGPLETAAVFTV